jgi:excisionase family DNA binding protein
MTDMDTLLTTRQLQDLLQVDRITIYRMLNDGRLQGFKVGGQWRFSRQEIEQWLQEQRADLHVTDISAPVDGQGKPSPQVLPLSCVQAIQDVCAEALDVASVTTDLSGTPLVEISNSRSFCNLILSTQEGRRRCAASWSQVESSQVRTCHAGLLCASAFVIVNGQAVAITANCQIATLAWQADTSTLAAELDLNERELAMAAKDVQVSDEHLARVSSLLQRVAATFSEIGEERMSLLNRLRHIAQISSV